jgi:SAM-dependent methyltransferase
LIKDDSLLIDYACGSGVLLSKILKDSKSEIHVVGLDGSQKLLDDFKQNFFPTAFSNPSTETWSSNKVSLYQTTLPQFNLPEIGDLCVWCFPNLIHDENHLDQYNDNGYQDQSWVNQAHKLAHFREMDPDECQDQDSTVDDRLDEYLSQRVIHKNICGILKPKGLFVKIEYANCNRNELSDLTLMRSAFMEGTLAHTIKEHQTTPFFKLIHSEYHKSEVILDVYEQTKDETDKEGGFTINIFEKL